jgi:hypothetical protein
MGPGLAATVSGAARRPGHTAGVVVTVTRWHAALHTFTQLDPGWTRAAGIRVTSYPAAASRAHSHMGRAASDASGSAPTPCESNPGARTAQ